MASASGLEPVVLALDWTPNTNHVGFYIAQALGYYSEVGLSVKLLSPHLDSYDSTPASRVANKTATFALAPPETVVSYHLPPQRPKLVAVASLLQEDLSAIVTLKSSGISRPKQLDGKVYASYAARFEGRIVQRLIQADGGKGDYKESTPEKLGIWNTLVSGNADATWVFKGWEGVEAALKGLELNEFTLADYGIPYLPAPVLVAHPDTLRDKAALVRKFLKASSMGFDFAVQSPAQAASLFTESATRENPALPNPLDPIMISNSLQFMGPHFLDSIGSWGTLSEDKWAKYIDWLSKEDLLSSFIQSRNPVPGVSVSLDDLRQGNIGRQSPIWHTITSEFVEAHLPPWTSGQEIKERCEQQPILKQLLSPASTQESKKNITSNKSMYRVECVAFFFYQGRKANKSAVSLRTKSVKWSPIPQASGSQLLVNAKRRDR